MNASGSHYFGMKLSRKNNNERTNMKVTINVSKHNIRYGDPSDGKNCIVQRAIRDAIPLADQVTVAINDYAMVHVGGGIHHTDLPMRVRGFVIQTLFVNKILPPYLRWILLRPFSFELEVPARFCGVEPMRQLQSSLPAPRSIPIESPESPETPRSPEGDRPDEALSR